jgi:hypothetical protein
MKATFFRTKRASIAAAPVLEMQNKDSRVFKVACKLMFRTWATANALQGATNLGRQSIDVLRVPGVLGVHPASTGERRRGLNSHREYSDCDQNGVHDAIGVAHEQIGHTSGLKTI